jgi:hypothetical protein
MLSEKPTISPANFPCLPKHFKAKVGIISQISPLFLASKSFTNLFHYHPAKRCMEFELVTASSNVAQNKRIEEEDQEKKFLYYIHITQTFCAFPA